MEFAPESVAEDLPGLLDWLQVEPADDRDGDGRGADDELFFGTDPFTADEVDLGILDDGVSTTVTVSRSLLAGGEVPALWRSEDLIDWVLVEDASVWTDPLGGDLEQVKLEVTLDPRPERQFFQVGR